jgi:hypothetical protein
MGELFPETAYSSNFDVHNLPQKSFDTTYPPQITKYLNNM